MLEEGRGGVYFLIKINLTLLSKILLIFIQHNSSQES